MNRYISLCLSVCLSVYIYLYTHIYACVCVCVCVCVCAQLQDIYQLIITTNFIPVFFSRHSNHPLQLKPLLPHSPSPYLYFLYFSNITIYATLNPGQNLTLASSEFAERAQRYALYENFPAILFNSNDSLGS